MNYELGKEKDKSRALSARLPRSRFHHNSLFLIPNSSSMGFSLVELLVAIAIGAIITLIVAGSFAKAPAVEALDKETGIIVSLLATARNSTLSGEGSSVYGVHFETTKAVLFSGATYSPGAASNKTELMNPLVQISDISLAGGGSNVVFNRLTGQTAQSGTVTVSLAGASLSKTITIFGTGLAQSN